MRLMNAQRDDAVGIVADQRRQPVGRIVRDRIEEAGTFEKTGLGLMRKAVLEIPVIVLIRFRMDNDGVLDSNRDREAAVFFDGQRGGFVRAVRGKRKALRIVRKK